MPNFIIIGAPGSGKGTQAKKLAARMGLFHLSAGDVLRAEEAAGTDIGNMIGEIMARGELAPDDFVMDVIVRRFKQPDCAAGVIFDGFPRTLAQAVALDDTLDKMGTFVTAAIELKVDDAAMTERVKSRAASEGMRSDDGAISDRLKIYHLQSEPVIDHYKNKGILKPVDGMKPIDEVAADIEKLLQGDRGIRTAAGMRLDIS